MYKVWETLLGVPRAAEDCLAYLMAPLLMGRTSRVRGEKESYKKLVSFLTVYEAQCGGCFGSL